MRLLVTGGAGFIGSRFVLAALQRGWADEVVVLDKLTYAGHLANLREVQHHPGYSFVRGDVAVPADVARALGGGTDGVFHFAAESHVDRSIAQAADFVATNVVGTQVLLDGMRKVGAGRLVHVSTDEVYGSLAIDDPQRFSETTPLSPSSPYAASKAAADLLVLACSRTHNLDAVVTRCSNNYGPQQYPEKLIPLFITRALAGGELPLYGDGRNVRDWIHVDDHALGLWQAFCRGEAGEVYNLGGECERPNRDIADLVLQQTGAAAQLIKPVGDRLAHDLRYAIDCSRARRELGFAPGPPIEGRIGELVSWYRDNLAWWHPEEASATRH